MAQWSANKDRFGGYFIIIIIIIMFERQSDMTVLRLLGRKRRKTIIMEVQDVKLKMRQIL